MVKCSFRYSIMRIRAFVNQIENKPFFSIGSLDDPVEGSKANPLKRLHEDTEDADNQGEEGNTFDQSRRDNHSSLNSTGEFRLSGHAFNGGSSDSSDTVTTTDDDQTGSDSSSGQAVRCFRSGSNRLSAILCEDGSRCKNDEQCEAEDGDFSKLVHEKSPFVD